MRKIIILSILLSSVILANRIPIPLSDSFLSVENNGKLSAIDAYQDGVGIYVSEKLGGGEISNVEMNSLVFKYGEAAKAENVTVKKYVSENGSNSEKALNVGKFEPMIAGIPDEGSQCDDNDDTTTGDIYVNGVCVGVSSGYVQSNGIVKCNNVNVGEEFMINSKSYLVVDNSTILKNRHRTDTICTSHVTDMAYLFNNNMSSNLSVGHWDVSNVVSMSRMFFYAVNFNEDLSNWDVSNVKTMASMFAKSTGSGAVVLGKFQNGGKPLSWTTSSLEDMSSMFALSMFNQYIGDWDTSKVTNMSGLFSGQSRFNNGAPGYTNGPALKWNTSNVTNMNNLLNNNQFFNTDLSKWCANKATKVGLATAATGWGSHNMFGNGCPTDYIN